MKPRQPAPNACGANPGRAALAARRMSSDGRKEKASARHRTSLPGLRDPVPPRPDRGLRPLLRAARSGLRPRRAAPHRHPRVDRGRAAVDLALRAAAAGRAARRAAAARRAGRRSSARRGSRRRSASASSGSSSTRRTRRIRSRTASSPSRPRRRIELGRTTLACSSTGNLANAVAARAAAEGLEAVVLCPADLEPEKLIATAVYGAKIFAVEGSYDDCSRLTRRAVVRARLGVRERRAPLVLRGGLEDARVRDRRAARLGRCPTPSSRRSRRARCSRRCTRASASCSSSGSSTATTPRLIGGQAEGCSPVATRVRRRRAR